MRPPLPPAACLGAFAACLIACFVLAGCDGSDDGAPPPSIKVGVAVVALTPCGNNPTWTGPVTVSGVWGEQFTDTNGNGRWDLGEPFTDDPVNTEIDRRSEGKYDGIYLAGFGNDRIATGCHDDIWARALVIEGPSAKVALVSVDFVGTVTHGAFYGFARAREQVDADLGIDSFIFASTHSHEGPDTLGLWGVDELTDGKFPRYLQWVDSQVARAINEAGAPANMRPARVIAAQTDPEADPTLLGLQVRTGCRPPWFFDQELRALQFVDPSSDETIATLINWNTHPESLEDENTLVSSDFIHYIRAKVEAELGGTAVYFTGDLGAVEIVGDTCVGGADPRNPDNSNEFDRRDDLGFARTQSIGDIVGAATVAALRDGETLQVADLQAKSESYHLSGKNFAFSLGNQVGVLDLDPAVFDLKLCPAGAAICVAIEQHLLGLQDRTGKPLAQLLTIPGEIFPELIYGVEENLRTDCPAADRGQPAEPAVRDAMTAPYRFFLGLSPDEFGYIVPGYDFLAAPGLGDEAADACKGQSYDPEVPRRRVPDHYHESLAVGLDIAASTTCYGLRLLGEEDELQANAACRRALRLP